jgi:cytidylate kinase
MPGKRINGRQIRKSINQFPEEQINSQGNTTHSGRQVAIRLQVLHNASAKAYGSSSHPTRAKRADLTLS